MANMMIYCKCGCYEKASYLTTIGTKRQYIHGHNGTGKKRIFTKEWIENIRKAATGKEHSEITKEKKRLIALKRNPINTNYFKKLNKRNAYVLGYLFADGNLHIRKNSGNLMLSFLSKDRELIDKIKNEFLIQHRKTKFSSSKSVKYYSLQINNYHFLNYLKKLGLKAGKKAARILIPKKIYNSKTFFSSFIRGFFDGDGWVSSIKFQKTPTVTFVTASFKFLKQLKKHLIKNKVTSGKIRKGKNSNAYHLSCHGKQNIYNFYKFIYKNSDNLFLSRKKKRFEEYFKDYNWRII